MIFIRERCYTCHEGEGESKKFAAEGVDCFHIAIIIYCYTFLLQLNFAAKVLLFPKRCNRYVCLYC